MRRTHLLLLSLLWSLVDSQTVPYVSFGEETLPNHGYVNLSLVGNAGDGSDSVQCITDLTSCCTGDVQGVTPLASADRPDWYFPDGVQVGFLSGGGDIYQARGAQRNDLRRRNNALSSSGIYHCEIPTDDGDGGFMRKTVYVGIYGGGGDIVISGDVTLTVDSDLNGANPQFNLTCISTGGPATTVTWTRDSVTVTEGTETVLDDPVTAQYTHTLTLTRRLGGLYTCTVTNNKPSNDSANFIVQVASAPTNVMAVQEGSDGIRVTWTPSSDATGYIISYTDGVSSDNMTVDGGSTDNHTLTGLQNGATYTISIVATSQHFFSDAVTVNMVVGLVPDQPALSVDTVTATSISLSWSDSVATSYEVIWTSDQCPDDVDEGNDTITATNYTIMGLREGTAYNITVSVINSAGTSSSDTVTAETKEEVPSGAPTSVSATSTSNSITVQWEPVDCIDSNGVITGYSVRYGEEGTTEVVSGNETTITGLESSTTYSIQVAAVNSAGTGVYSDPITAETDDALLVSLNSSSATSLTISWTLDEGVTATSYTISYENTDTDCFTMTYDDITTSEMTVELTGLEEGTEYSITVTATLSDDTSAEDDLTATTMAAAPSAAPDSVSVSAVNSTAITVQWEAVNCTHRNGDITGYSVQYTGGGSTQTMNVSGDSSGGMVTISGLSPATMYTVQVAAVNSAGTGVYSDHMMISTPDIVYLNLRGDIIPNHGYVEIGDIGSTNTDALICHTDRPASNGNTNPEGDWFAPDGDSNVPGFMVKKAPMIIRLLSGSGAPAQGIYHCSIEVQSDHGMLQSVYVGLYHSGGGTVSLSGGVAFILLTDLEFILTCNSSGGPPTTVTWTRDSETINDTKAAKTELVDEEGETAQYTHTLPGRQEGLYTCTVTNKVSPESSAELLVQAPSPPTEVTVSQNGLGSLLVSWTPPSGGADVTGYTIYYQYSMALPSMTAEATTTSTTITGLITGVTYSINVVANSTTLPSNVTTAPDITIEPATISLTSSSPSIMAGDTVTLTCSVILPSGVTGTPVFQWEGSGVTPTPADSTTSGRMVSSDLTLSEISTSQAGLYTCTATLSGSITTSAIITVQIPAPTPFITISTTERTAGTTLSLTCDYTLSPSVDTTVETEVTWMVNGSPVATSADGHISVAGVSLIFSPLTTSDTGTYTCTLTITTPQTPHVTVQEPVESEEEVITVQIPQPSVDVTLSRSAPLYAGTSLTLTCTVTLDPNVNNNERVMTEWSGPQSIPGDRYSVTPAMRESDSSYTGSLTISPLADQNDDDTYTCTVTVTGGTQSVTASDDVTITVTALPAPVVTISPASGDLTAGQTYSLTCSVVVVSHLVVEPSIQWSRQNGGVVSTSTGTSLPLSFNPLMTSDGDLYTCRASVDITSISVSVSGEESSDLIVTIPRPTVVITRSHTGIVYAGTEFTLTASITFTEDVDLTLDISWTRGSETIISDTRITVSGVSGSDTSYTASLTFSPISTDDTGSYTVTVSPTTTSQYIQTVMASDTEVVDIMELRDPVVTISGVSDGLAGDDLSLTCTVTVVEYLTVVPTVQWSGGSVGLEDGVTESETSDDGVNSMRTLTFSPLHTSHGAEYICQAEISISSISVMKIASGSERVMVQIPTPVMMVYGSEMELVSGSSLTLTCSITLPISVDTPTTVMSSWTAPNSTYNTVNTVNDTSVELMISSVETADSGDYICSATLTDSSDSVYVVDSEPATQTVSITVKLNVTVSADYTAAPGENADDLGPNEFTAASILNLNCTVLGNSGTLTYEWSVTGNPDTSDCRSCTIIGTPPHTSTLRLAELALNSYHAGIYTCTVSESGRPDSGNSDDFTVTVVGAGIYSYEAASGFVDRPIANNGLIVSKSGDQLSLECVSSQSALGVITGLDDTMFTGNSVLRVANPFDRPGVRRLRTNDDTPLTATDQGIYTCTVPDSNDNQIAINVGLYPTGFSEGPTVSTLTYHEDDRTVVCVSTGSPATTVSWMKDGQPLITDDSTDYTLTQTITDRVSSTYSNVLTVSEGVSVAGTYTCTVTNDLRSNSSVVVAVGISITGLESPLTVGQNATISCMTNIAVSSIELRDQSSVLDTNDDNQNVTVLEYTIPLVRDDLQGEQLTCTAVAGETTYTETVDIQVTVPADSLVVETVVSEAGPVEAGSGDLTLTCTVSEVISGLNNMPSAQWNNISGGPVAPGDDIAVTETVINATTVTVTLTFSSLHTSHAGQYTCQGTLVSLAPEDITSTSDPVSVIVILPTPTLDLSVPSDPLYEGTSQTLNCTVTLPDTVDTDVNVTVQWTHNDTMTDVMISDVYSMRSPFISTLTLSPLSMTDAGQYSCVATADSSSQYISTSPENTTEETLDVTDLPVPNVTVMFPENLTAGQSYSLQCSASVVDGLVVLPDMKIVHLNSTVISEVNSDSVEYMFSPLRTSDGGQYTCTATINIPDAGITDLNTSVMANVTVAIPEPTITFTGPPVDPSTGTLYSGTVFTLTCVVTLVSEVDTNVTVLTSWTKNDTDLNGTSRISVDSEATLITTSAYGSDVMFSPLRGSGDDGNYTCSAEVSDSEYITGSSSSRTQAISVEDLNQPLVNVTTEGVTTAGETLSLVCTVETEEGVSPGDISINWIGPNGTIPTGENIVIKNLSTTGNVATGRLEFSPLRTSDSGEYTCVGQISNVGANVSSNDSEKISVTIPAPDVSLSLNTDNGTVYQGTELVITCTVTVDSAVDTDYDINITWTSDPAGVMNGTYITISDITDSRPEYTSTVTISPVNTTDSATYTCRANVTTTDLITSSMENIDSEIITVEELMKPVVFEHNLSSMAGENFSVECRFMTADNLVTAPSVQWKNSSGSVMSDNATLSFSPLLTSDGGEYTCNVTINITELGVTVTNENNTTITVEIPSPTVVIKAVGKPYNGSVYILTCIVRVDDSVNTDITISSQWLNDTGVMTGNTISNNSEEMGLEERHNLTFSPLRSEDDGMYRCTATITPKGTQFVTGSSASNDTTVTVEELPAPNVDVRLNSSTGSGDDSCLSANFSSPSDTLTCVAGVVSNLLKPPNIDLARGGSLLESESDDVLTYTLSGSVTGVFNCTVCIDVQEADIMNHCNSSTVTITEDVPEQITPVKQMDTDSQITIKWTETSEDIVRYVLDVREYSSAGPGKTKNKSITGYPRVIPATETQYIVTSLKPGVPYEYIFVAGNVRGCGDQYNSSAFFTKEEYPSHFPHNVTVKRLNGTAMNVSFVELSLVEARRRTVVYTITYSPSGSRKRQVKEVIVPNDTSHHVIGGLNPDSEYTVRVSAGDGRGNENTSKPVSVPLEEDGGDDSGGSPVAPVIGGVIAALVIAILVVIVILVILYIKRARDRQHFRLFSKNKSHLYETPSDGNEMVTLRSAGPQETVKKELESRAELEDSNVHGPPVPQSVVTDRLKPISVDSFRDHVNKMHEERDKGFEAEYQSLGTEPLATHEIAKKPCNRSKNRFANIFPYDESRVTLEQIPGEEGSDYINACWMDGYNHTNTFIAAQGPMPNTVVDFWRMVWQYKLHNIVILTKCMEAGRRKCEQYWSDNIGEVFETQDKKMEITTTSFMPFADFEIRTFNVKNITEPDEKPLAVTQYHFTSWPDHGVPKFATSLISFIRRVQKAHNKDDGVPLLVHCSAGVGRTGTFTLLDSMLERIKAEKTVNVYEFLVGLRQKRVLMVQTLPQYVFIHDALCELITCGETDIAAPALKVKIQRLAKVVPGKGLTGFQEQFQLLDQVSRKPEEEDYTDAREHYNRSKNRYLDRLPYNMSRARLRPTGEDGSEYINASFIDGYKRRNAYIATQSPLQNTVGDLWRMMWEFKSKVMVMLCSFTEDGHEACHPFWPNNEGDTAKYGKINVTFQSETPYDNFFTRKFLIYDDKVAHAAQTEGIVVTQFHMSGWPEHGRPASTGSVVEMLDMITKAQMSSGNRAITVLCNDGVGRTGTFICLHSQLERLKTEGVVDFFQAVKSARIQRAGLLPDADQYAYCHEVLADFVNSYDNYANFKDVV